MLKMVLVSPSMCSHSYAYFQHTHTHQLLHQGHSRVPVFEGTHSNVVGLLLVKRLIKLDPDDCTPVHTLEGAHTPPPSCLTTLPLYELLNSFQTGRSKPGSLQKHYTLYRVDSIYVAMATPPLVSMQICMHDFRYL